MQNLLERPPVCILSETLGIIRFLGPEHSQLTGVCAARLSVTRPSRGLLSPSASGVARPVWAGLTEW